MVLLKNRYVIGTHVMFFEIEMFKDFIDSLINLLETVENKENVIVDLCIDKLIKDKLIILKPKKEADIIEGYYKWYEY